jgi:hypothetical protein
MSQFHQFWVNQVKLKSNASFAAWEEYKGITRLKLIIGGEPKYLSLTGDFSNVTIETYAELIKQITE